ncbi:hypothetical protein CRE_20053 [Caenorhabditis remanei]|uniref:SPK domain-containing protein n=1 Tax=Caenorhabditis remanei TaxID=31234 RepID=E3NHH5_CAERE|nr:hypothetical protein CRE_20053 [Caenorhabditis remanei]
MTRVNEKDLLAVIMLETAKATEPYPNKDNFKKFARETGTKASVSSYIKTFRRIVDTLDTVRNYSLEEKARMLFMTSTPVDENMLEEMREIAVIEVNEDNQIMSYKSKQGPEAFQGQPWKLRKRKNGHKGKKSRPQAADESLKESDKEEVLGAVVGQNEDLNDLQEEPEPDAVVEESGDSEDVEDPLNEHVEDSEVLEGADYTINVNYSDDRQLPEEDYQVDTGMKDSEGKKEIFSKIYEGLDGIVTELIPEDLNEIVEKFDMIPGETDLAVDEIDMDFFRKQYYEDLEDMESLDQHMLDVDEEGVNENTLEIQKKYFGDLEEPIAQHMEIDEILEEAINENNQNPEREDSSTPSVFSDFPSDDATGDSEGSIQEDMDSLCESRIEYVDSLDEEFLNESVDMDIDFSLDDDIDLLSSLSDETNEDSGKNEQLNHQVVSNPPKKNLKRKLESQGDGPIAKKIPGGEHESWTTFRSLVKNYGGNENPEVKAILSNEAFLKSISPEFPYSERSISDMLSKKVHVEVQTDRAPTSVPSFMRLSGFHNAWLKAQEHRKKALEAVDAPPAPEPAPSNLLKASEAQSKTVDSESAHPAGTTKPERRDLGYKEPGVRSTHPQPSFKPKLFDQAIPHEPLVSSVAPPAIVNPELQEETIATSPAEFFQSEIAPPAGNTETTPDVKAPVPRVSTKQKLPDPRPTVRLEILDQGIPHELHVNVSAPNVIIKQERQDAEYIEEEEPVERVPEKLLTNRFFISLESFLNEMESNELRGLLQRIKEVRENGETRGLKFNAETLSVVVDVLLASLVKKSMNDEICKRSTLLPLMNEVLDKFLFQMKAIGCSKMTLDVTMLVESEKKRIEKEVTRVSYKLIADQFSKMIDNLMPL